MSFSLIVPVAADKIEYGNDIPYIFRENGDREMVCVKSVLGLNLDVFDQVVFTILKKHDDSFGIHNKLTKHLRDVNLQDKARIIMLDTTTSSQCETVSRTIEIMGIKGGIMIKDGDSYFKTVIRCENSICAYPLDALSLVNPQSKSYVAFDDCYYITNIIESRIIGRYFNAGGYVFASADEFQSYFNSLRRNNGLKLSHIVYSMLLNSVPFKAIECADFKDWGTIEDYHLFQ